MADKKANKIKYSEPAEYFPKELRDMFDTKTAKKKTVKGSKKKK